jgi:hypothetical protein
MLLLIRPPAPRICGRQLLKVFGTFFMRDSKFRGSIKWLQVLGLKPLYNQFIEKWLKLPRNSPTTPLQLINTWRPNGWNTSALQTATFPTFSKRISTGTSQFQRICLAVVKGLTYSNQKWSNARIAMLGWNGSGMTTRLVTAGNPGATISLALNHKSTRASCVCTRTSQSPSWSVITWNTASMSSKWLA